MPASFSAVDAVSPAFADTRRILFAPWSLATWMRMAVLGLFTGEYAGGGWFESPAEFNLPYHHRSDLPQALFSSGGSLPSWVRENWMWFALCAVLLVILFFVVQYLASISRFVLFDAVATGRTELRSGWTRWRSQGIRYFFWNVGFAAVCFAALFGFVGIPLWTIIRNLPPGQPDYAVLIAQVMSVLFSMFVFFLFVALINLFAKDFLVPVMALENCGVWRGWRRVLAMAGEEKLAYTGYVLMKIVLAVGSAVLFGIIDFLAFLILLIPFGIVGVATYFIVRGLNLAWDFGTISLLVVTAGLITAVFLYVFAFLYAPGLVFFQSYTLRFLAPRFPALDALMNRRAAPPAAPPAASPATT